MTVYYDYDYNDGYNVFFLIYDLNRDIFTRIFYL